MSQDKILKILKERGNMFATQIINELKESDEPKLFIRNSLKQMRKYHEVGFIYVGIADKKNNLLKYKITDLQTEAWKIVKFEVLCKKFPELEHKKITRCNYLYYFKQ